METLILIIGCLNCIFLFGLGFAAFRILMYLAPFEEDDNDDAVD